MKDEFFAGLFEQARKTANELLDKVEAALCETDLPGDSNESVELENLRFDNDRLTQENTILNDRVDELTAAVQVLLDGEVSKDITMPWGRYWNLRDATVDVAMTDDTLAVPGQVTISITQNR